VINRFGVYASKTGLPPTFFTFLGVLFALFSGLAFSNLFLNSIVGGLLLLLSGFADILDGSVARATGSVSARGAFFDSTLDRVAEIFVFTGIITGDYIEPVIVLVALSLSLMVSYARAKGESLGINLSGTGIGERAERILVLSIASIVGFVNYGVMIVLVLALITFIHRSVIITRSLKPKI
jgi:archaetidylinositol phosphate synthase